MMLYVFHVDVGRMLTFDMSLAITSVDNLKDTIQRLHGIPAANIVLLVSGGEVLTTSTQVSAYSSGTDTNPIYMFLRGEGRLPPIVPQTEPDIDLSDQVARCQGLPAEYASVDVRAQLAIRMYNLSRDEHGICERLVWEQHLQQQGWSAVIANLDDMTKEFRQRFENFCTVFNCHLEKRSKYFELLKNFRDDLTKLSRIPILPGLMPLAAEDFHEFDEFLNTDEVFSRSHAQQESVLVAGLARTASNKNVPDGGQAQSEAAEGDAATSDERSSMSPNKKQKLGNETIETQSASSNSQNSTSGSTHRRTQSLLQWITSKENQNVLTLMSDECIQGLSTFSETVYEKLRQDVQNLIKSAEQADVREIKGLSERLCALDTMKHKIKQMLQNQKEQSTGFQQNQNRAKNLRDDSILPDLCASHQEQLTGMLNVYKKICEYRHNISKAKNELGNNLHRRLERISWIENHMNEFDNTLLFYHRCLKRAERHIQIIEQIHQAPCIYVAAVTEVVRRKIFSGEFCQWASKLADDFDVIHSEEIKRRELFNASLEGHFLKILFPGMNDMPPTFSNQTPLVFDARLPNITKSDIDMLTSHLPDLASQIQLPDMGPVINFFVSRSGSHQMEHVQEFIKQESELLLAPSNTAGSVTEPSDEGEQPSSSQPLLLHVPQHPRLSELQKEGVACDESETDTETEFEKVPVSAQAVAVATSTSENQNCETISRSTTTSALLTRSAETLTEETESSMRAEVQRLRHTLAAMFKLSAECIRLSRADLESFRSSAQLYREDMESELQMLNEKWAVIHKQYQAREEELQAEKWQSNTEVQRLEDTLRQRECELEALQHLQSSELDPLRIKCVTLETQLEELRDKLNAAQLEREGAVSEVREELIREHKNEIESLRCRYKLMTSMELSPSDTSLEKLERPTSSSDQNTIDRMDHETAMAELRATLELEKEKAVAAAVEAERVLWQSKIIPLNSESVMANVNILKDMIEEKERQLDALREKDLMLTKENYQLKTRIDALTNEEGNSWLKEKIEYLNRDKRRLEDELTMEKSRRIEMESSVAALKCSNEPQGGPLPRSKSSGSSHKYIVLDSCTRGDIVLVVWNMRHGQFMVVQDSQSLYFVHADSLPSLNLSLPVPNETGATDALAIPIPFYAIGRVVDKEYCQAKKDENRYRVTRGSKFHRIKLAPLLMKSTSSLTAAAAAAAVASRRVRLESFSTSFSRSVSQCESSQSEPMAVGAAGPSNWRTTYGEIVLKVGRTGSDGSSPLPLNVTAVDAPTSEGQSVTDSSGVITGGGVIASSTASSSGAVLKERTISISSVAEEDDETAALSSLSDRCRYISVTEEDEGGQDTPMGANVAAATITTQQQSVITEQPTSSSKLKLDLLLASTDIPQQQEQKESQDEKLIASSSGLVKSSTVISTSTTSTLSNLPIITRTGGGGGGGSGDGTSIVSTDTCSPTVPCVSYGGTTTSEDSDEYRSLEGKDDTDFTISE